MSSMEQFRDLVVRVRQEKGGWGPVAAPTPVCGHYWYLGSPYSHQDDRELDKRNVLAQRATAALIGMGNIVYSPIAHSHGVALSGFDHVDARDHNLWMKQCEAMLQWAAGLFVLPLPGFEVSEGLAREVGLMEDWERPVVWLEPMFGQRVLEFRRSPG